MSESHEQSESTPIAPRDNADEISEAKTSTTTSSEEVKQAHSCMEILRRNPAYNDIANIFYFRDPVKSGLLFGIFNFFFFLISYGEYTVLTLISYLLFSLLAVCVGYANYVVLKASWLQGKHAENPFKERFKDAKFHLSRETAQKHLDTVVDLVNLTIDTYRDVFYSVNLALSLKWLAYFFLLAQVGKIFCGETLIYLTGLGCFIWSRLYEEKQKEIDQAYAIARKQADVYIQLGLSKVPPAVTAKLPFLKPKSN